jgi:hypothetical protein
VQSACATSGSARGDACGVARGVPSGQGSVLALAAGVRAGDGPAAAEIVRSPLARACRSNAGSALVWD